MWRTRPVFISSTFVDMQAERDHLRTRVFPELEERLRARRHNLEWVDLRVGVATASKSDEHVRELHVLKVCLDEVRRCRPFLIVLLGDRYGWVPPEDRIRAAAEEAREGFSANVAGRSVTDLEIDFGVLSDPDQQPRSIFYFRDPLPYGQMPANVAALFSDAHDRDPAAADRVKRLAALKQRIEGQLPDRVRHYAAQWDGTQVTGLEAWGKTVLEDIWSSLEDEIGPAAPADVPWQQVERDALEDFVDDRARDFVGRQQILARLIEVATHADAADASQGACVTGDPGSGKSALFGELFRQLEASDVCLLAHAAGASVQAPSVDAMLRRWIGELAGVLAVDPGLGDDADPDTVDATFARLLGQMAQQRRVVLLIDALDQFETTTRAQYLTWLPRLWPANARVLATAIAGTASQALAERPGIEGLTMPPLDAGEARDIVVGICRRYHREFEPEVIDALLAKTGATGPPWTNPLWLVLAVEELNLLDADDFARAQRAYAGAPGARLRALMIDIVAQFPSHIPGLYAHTFGRAEALFGAMATRAFLGLIAVGRAGWRESDFRFLLPRVSGEVWDELKFAQLRRLFRGQVRQRGALAQWDFNHAQMRTAVRAHIAAAGIVERKLHAMIADHLLADDECPRDDLLRLNEAMFHLLGSEEWARAANHYGDDSLDHWAARGATWALAEHLMAAPGRADTIARLLAAPGLDDAAARQVTGVIASRCLSQLVPTIANRVPLATRASVLDHVQRAFARLAQADANEIAWQRGLADSYLGLGDVRDSEGQLDGALQFYRNSFTIYDRLSKAEPRDADRRRRCAAAIERIAAVQMARGDLAAALASHRDSLALSHIFASFYPESPIPLQHIAESHQRIARIQQLQCDVAGALKSFGESFAIMDRLTKAEPDNVGWQLVLGRALDGLGDMQDAEAASTSRKAAFAIIERLARSDPGNATSQRNLAIAYLKSGKSQAAQKDHAAALRSYGDGLAIMEKVARLDPSDADKQHDLAGLHDAIGDVHDARRDPVSAEKSYRESLAIMDRLVKSSAGNAGWQHEWAVTQAKIGEERLLQGDPRGAIACHRDCLAVWSRLAASDSGVEDWRRKLALVRKKLTDAADWLADEGDARGARGEREAAMEFYRDGLAVRRELAQSEPDDAQRQRATAVMHSRIGSVQRRGGDLAGALTAYREGLPIFEQLAESDAGNADRLRDLAIAYNQIAEVQFAQGDPAEALPTLKASLAIFVKIADANPDDEKAQDQLARMLKKTGDAQLAQQDLQGALESYGRSLRLLEQLAEAQPESTDREFNVASAWSDMAVLYSRGNNLEAILWALRNGRAVLTSLARRAPDDPEVRSSLAWFEDKISQLTEKDER